MNCPKCGLTINGSASKCPRCLCKISKDQQNIVPQNNEENDDANENNFTTSDYSQYASQQNVNNKSMFYWIGQVFKKYTEFNGRARRKEYWFFVLMTMIVSMFFTILAIVTETIFPSILSLMFSMGILIPSWAVLVRRLHDTDRSGVKVLMGLIPIAGPIILLVYVAQDSTPGDNQYGPCPK